MCFPLVCIAKLQIDISSKLELLQNFAPGAQTETNHNDITSSTNEEQRILIILFDWLYISDNHFT